MFIDICDDEQIIAEFDRLLENLDEGKYPDHPSTLEDEQMVAVYDARLDFEPAIIVASIAVNAPPHNLLSSASDQITQWIDGLYGPDIWEHVVLLEEKAG